MLSTANLAAMDTSSVDTGEVPDAPTLALTARHPSSDSLASSIEQRSPHHAALESATSSPSVNPAPATPTRASARAINIKGSGGGGGFTRNLSVSGLQAASISSSYGQSMLEGAGTMHDFHQFGMGPKGMDAEAGEAAEAAEALHVASPGKYVQTIQTVGLELIDYRDLSEHLSVFYDAMVEEVRARQSNVYMMTCLHICVHLHLWVCLHVHTLSVCRTHVRTCPCATSTSCALRNICLCGQLWKRVPMYAAGGK